VLVAKQTAEVDLLCGGRFRLGVGSGWNPVEYEALGLDFHTRGKRMEEQVVLLRKLWTEELVTYEGRWEHITDAGLNPLPVQRPIPVWMGGAVDAVLERIGRIGDGWMLSGRPAPDVAEKMERIRQSARAAGRDPSRIGLQGTVQARLDPVEWMQDMDAWLGAGATHVTVHTMNAGFESPAEHVAALERVKKALQ
jgi:probable F420-dependent oxidoreductase